MNESSGEISLKKRELRKSIRARLKFLSPDQLKNKSESIAQRLFSTEWWEEARWIFGYITMPGEVDTEEIIERAYKDLKKVVIPRIEGEDLVFYQYQGRMKELLPNRFGILEPDPGWRCVNPDRIINEALLIITPGMGFDRAKRRLGRGKGFYDRFLRMVRCGAALNARAVGLSFSEQVVPKIPVRAHDQPVDGIITDLEIIK